MLFPWEKWIFDHSSMETNSVIFTKTLAHKPNCSVLSQAERSLGTVTKGHLKKARLSSRRTVRWRKIGENSSTWHIMMSCALGRWFLKRKEGRKEGREEGIKRGGKGKRKKVRLDISKSNLNVMGSEIYETTELVVLLIYIRNIYINSDKNLEIKQFKTLQTKTSCFYLG